MAMSRCRWKSCTVDTVTPEALFAHLCDSHYATLPRCERRHFFACEWKGCGELVPCPGSKGETLLCAVKGHLLDHAEYRPKSLGALRTLKFSGSASSLSPGEVPAPGTAAADVVHSDAGTSPPHIRIPHLSHPVPGSSAPPSLDVSVPYSDAAPRSSSSTITPPSPRTHRTTSPTSDLPPPLVHSPGVGFATWKCKWSACTINLPVPFANGEDLLQHVLEVHVRPNTPRDVVSVRTRTWRKVTCKWFGESGECNEEVVIRAKYVAHFEGHIFANFEHFKSTSPVRLTSVPLIPPPPPTPTPTPTPKRPRGRPRKAEMKPDADAETDVRPLKKRLRGNDAIDVDGDEGTIVVRWGGSRSLPGSVPLPGFEVQPESSSSQLELEHLEDPSVLLSPSEIEMGDGSPRGSTTDSEDEEDDELDWSLN